MDVFSFVVDKIERNEFTLWIVASAAFVVSFLFLSALQKLFFISIATLSKKTNHPFWILFLSQIKSPIRALILLFSFFVSIELFFPNQSKLFKLVFLSLKVGFILAGAWIIERSTVALILSGFIGKKLSSTTRTLMVTLTRVFLFSLCLLVMLDTLGVSITPILASLGVGSLAVALALQDTLSNFFSGLYILADKPIRIGDFIRIKDGVEGYVRRIGWRSAQIELLTNDTAIIPNSKLATSLITNFEYPNSTTTFSLTFHIAFQSDLDLVEKHSLEIAKEVIGQVPGCVLNHPPTVSFSAIIDQSIRMSINLKVQSFVNMYRVRTELIKRIQKRFIEQKISLGSNLSDYFSTTNPTK